VHGVWGERHALYRDTLAQIPHVLNKLETFSVVPDAGHWVMFERPEAFHAVADSLLNPATPST
jgi:2-hydroxy-6-oxonona-2,4-dienedioate hydrolase